MVDRSPELPVRAGRRRSTSRDELERVAFELFERDGFDTVTVDEIAKTAGIGRRTFFRYFESKNDVVWGAFTEHLNYMREEFARRPADEMLMDAVRAVVVEFNRVDPAEVPRHRRRMELILRVPALQAHSTLRYRDWRAIVAEFAAARLGVDPMSLVPQSIAYATLGVALAAYEHWLAHSETELCDVLDIAVAQLSHGFDLVVGRSRVRE